LDDSEAYKKYPHHHKWFNKLWLSEKLGYKCGPGGVNVSRNDEYIVRPIMNLVSITNCTKSKKPI